MLWISALPWILGLAGGILLGSYYPRRCPKELPLEPWSLTRVTNAHKELHDLMMRNKKDAYEGHTGSNPEKAMAYRALSGGHARTICETGFNGGHSSATWLGSNPRARLYSFDLGAHPYVVPARDHLGLWFPGRLRLTLGDSKQTVPAFFERHPDVRCDIAHVDGGHAYAEAWADLENFWRVLRPGGLLLIDDTNCGEGYCVDKPWQDFLKKHEAELVPLRMELSVTGTGLSGVFKREN